VAHHKAYLVGRLMFWLPCTIYVFDKLLTVAVLVKKVAAHGICCMLPYRSRCATCTAPYCSFVMLVTSGSGILLQLELIYGFAIAAVP
jgi:hypothetical protein